MYGILLAAKGFWEHISQFAIWISASFVSLLYVLFGDPNYLTLLIVILFISDFLTRLIAETKKAGGISPKYVKKALELGYIKSKKFKEGLFVKVFFYTILMSVAHAAQMAEGLFIGDFIASTIYFAIVINDLISVLENMIEAGFSNWTWVLDKIKKKKE